MADFDLHRRVMDFRRSPLPRVTVHAHDHDPLLLPEDRLGEAPAGAERGSAGVFVALPS